MGNKTSSGTLWNLNGEFYQKGKQKKVPVIYIYIDRKLTLTITETKACKSGTDMHKNAQRFS